MVGANGPSQKYIEHGRVHLNHKLTVITPQRLGETD